MSTLKVQNQITLSITKRIASYDNPTEIVINNELFSKYVVTVEEKNGVWSKIEVSKNLKEEWDEVLEKGHKETIVEIKDAISKKEKNVNKYRAARLFKKILTTIPFL